MARGFKNPHVEMFVAKFVATGDITASAASAGVPVPTAMRWRAH